MQLILQVPGFVGGVVHPHRGPGKVHMFQGYEFNTSEMKQTGIKFLYKSRKKIARSSSQTADCWEFVQEMPIQIPATETCTFLVLVLHFASAQDYLCPLQHAMSNAHRDLMLYDHNLYRSRISQGLAIHVNGNPLPRASNVYEVGWNCYLEKLASEAVKGCPARKTKNLLHGQNYEFIESDDELDDPYPFALERWVSAVMDKQFGNDVIIFKEDNKLHAFANMIRANTTSIGCSQTRCGSFAAIACFYESPDIEKGELIYEKGNGCSSDVDCTTYEDSTCTTENSLCVAPRSNAISTATSIIDDSNFTSDAASSVVTLGKDKVEIMLVPNGTNTMCPQNFIMMDELRRKILLMHNYRRSLLTKGLVKNANGITLPPAANMVKLKYNCALEVFALSHAAKCAFNESDLLSQEDVGENVAVVYTENALTFLGAIRWALTSWWKTIGKEQSVMGRMVKFKKKHEGKSIRRFTQMAWADTQEVGCGIAKCGAAYNVVCRYSPRGNHLNHVIYKKGAPCTECPQHMLCEHETELCIQQEESKAAAMYPPFWMILFLVLCIS